MPAAILGLRTCTGRSCRTSLRDVASLKPRHLTLHQLADRLPMVQRRYRPASAVEELNARIDSERVIYSRMNVRRRQMPILRCLAQAIGAADHYAALYSAAAHQ